RMDIEHVDLAAAGERGETGGRTFQRRHQRQLAAEPLAKSGLVVGDGGPGVLLRRRIVLVGQVRDAVAEDFAQHGGVLRQIRPQCQLGMRHGHHRAISQVVPSLESFSTTPMAASSSRIRSDSLKFFALRAALRASTRLSTSSLDGVTFTDKLPAYPGAETPITVACPLAVPTA